ncbi:hypothetical protein [Sulfobacillus sp. hq2]|uniref:hypothetical protein n=1 Tax=Sulfobacillus TaxID=28033 RepID=UPI000CD2E86E|nr:hypothetical protein [Sulfobacillus sp. hq2]POB12326.1 hypothetical protein CO251_00215 [Sulfobacillus sp. hq2]
MTPIAWWFARLQSRWAVKSQTARGGGSVGPILWVVLAVIIIGSIILWWTKGGGSADLSNVLSNFTGLLNGANSSTAA